MWGVTGRSGGDGGGDGGSGSGGESFPRFVAPSGFPHTPFGFLLKRSCREKKIYSQSRERGRRLAFPFCALVVKFHWMALT